MKSYADTEPKVHPTVFIADTAAVIGAVELGDAVVGTASPIGKARITSLIVIPTFVHLI